jgi:uncharacterized membrane protein
VISLKLLSRRERGSYPKPIEVCRGIWFWLGWPVFLSMLAIFWLMVAKPA